MSSSCLNSLISHTRLAGRWGCQRATGKREAALCGAQYSWPAGGREGKVKLFARKVPSKQQRCWVRTRTLSLSPCLILSVSLALPATRGQCGARVYIRVVRCFTASTSRYQIPLLSGLPDPGSMKCSFSSFSKIFQT